MNSICSIPLYPYLPLRAHVDIRVGVSMRDVCFHIWCATVRAITSLLCVSMSCCVIVVVMFLNSYYTNSYHTYKPMGECYRGCMFISLMHYIKDIIPLTVFGSLLDYPRSKKREPPPAPNISVGGKTHRAKFWMYYKATIEYILYLYRVLINLS